MLPPMILTPLHVAHRRHVGAPLLSSRMAALSLTGGRGRSRRQDRPRVGLAGQLDQFVKGERHGVNFFAAEGRRALRAKLGSLATGGLVGCASAGCLSVLAAGLGATSAALTPQVAVLIGMGAAITAFALAGGDRSRISGAAPAFVAFEAIVLQPIGAAVAGGVTVGLLWAAHRPDPDRPRPDAAGPTTSGAWGRVPLPAAKRPPG